MPVPKKRQSPRRRNMRRANHDRMDPPSVTSCPNCGEPKMPHRVCKACGQYRERVVFAEAAESSEA